MAQVSGRKKIDIILSIQEKLIRKYGTDLASKQAIEKCIEKLKSKEKIGLKDFSALESQIVKDIQALQQSQKSHIQNRDQPYNDTVQDKYNIQLPQLDRSRQTQHNQMAGIKAKSQLNLVSSTSNKKYIQKSKQLFDDLIQDDNSQDKAINLQLLKKYNSQIKQLGINTNESKQITSQMDLIEKNYLKKMRNANVSTFDAQNNNQFKMNDYDQNERYRKQSMEFSKNQNDSWFDNQNQSKQKLIQNQSLNDILKSSQISQLIKFNKNLKTKEEKNQLLQQIAEQLNQESLLRGGKKRKANSVLRANLNFYSKTEKPDFLDKNMRLKEPIMQPAASQKNLLSNITSNNKIKNMNTIDNFDTNQENGLMQSLLQKPKFIHLANETQISPSIFIQKGRFSSEINQIKHKNGENVNTITGEPRKLSNLQAEQIYSKMNGRQYDSIRNSSNASQLQTSPSRAYKKDMSVWDALLLADQNQYLKEQEYLKHSKIQKLKEINHYNSELQHRIQMQQKIDTVNQFHEGKKYINRVDDAIDQEEKQEIAIKKQQAVEIVQGVLQCIKQKLNKRDLEKKIENEIEKNDDAYQQKKFQEIRNREQQRKREFKQAQQINNKLMTEKKQWDQQRIEERVIEKIGLSQQKLEKVKELQRDLAGGNNVYFEMNQIAFKNDQQKRLNKAQEIHDRTLESPLKNYTIQYDKERQKILKEIEDRQRAEKPDGLFRNPAEQIANSKQIVQTTQNINKQISSFIGDKKKQLIASEIDREKKIIKEKLKIYEDHLQEKEIIKRNEQQNMARFLSQQHSLKKEQQIKEDHFLNNKEFGLNKKLLQQRDIIDEKNSPKIQELKQILF